MIEPPAIDDVVTFLDLVTFLAVMYGIMFGLPLGLMTLLQILESERQDPE